MTLLLNGCTRFHHICRILSPVQLKHISFWPSVDVNTMSNDLAHALPCQHVFALLVCILLSSRNFVESLLMSNFVVNWESDSV